MSFFKNREQEGKTGGWHQYEVKDEGKGCRRVNMVEKLCAHV
jgi:hypothetical protein